MLVLEKLPQKKKSFIIQLGATCLKAPNAKCRESEFGHKFVAGLIQSGAMKVLQFYEICINFSFSNM